MRAADISNLHVAISEVADFRRNLIENDVEVTQVNFIINGSTIILAWDGGTNDWTVTSFGT